MAATVVPFKRREPSLTYKLTESFSQSSSHATGSREKMTVVSNGRLFARK
jgi:hypothetical protein